MQNRFRDKYLFKEPLVESLDIIPNNIHPITNKHLDSNIEKKEFVIKI